MSTLSSACQYEQNCKKNQDSHCLIEKFSTSKYLNKSKKEDDFLSKNAWFKPTGEDIDKYLKKHQKKSNY